MGETEPQKVFGPVLEIEARYPFGTPYLKVKVPSTTIPEALSWVRITKQKAAFALIAHNICKCQNPNVRINLEMELKQSAHFVKKQSVSFMRISG